MSSICICNNSHVFSMLKTIGKNTKSITLIFLGKVLILSKIKVLDLFSKVIECFRSLTYLLFHFVNHSMLQWHWFAFVIKLSFIVCPVRKSLFQNLFYFLSSFGITYLVDISKVVHWSMRPCRRIYFHMSLVWDFCFLRECLWNRKGKTICIKCTFKIKFFSHLLEELYIFIFILINKKKA